MRLSNLLLKFWSFKLGGVGSKDGRMGVLYGLEVEIKEHF